MSAALLCLYLGASMALAAPQKYRLNNDRSTVEFIFTVDGARQRGKMPVAAADMQIDLGSIADSRVSVTLKASALRTGIIFATQALKAPNMLDTKQHPTITFRSTSIRGTPGAATVTGDLTVRGVTRPVTLQAGLYRQQGSDAQDRDHLTILLTGAISRAAFGLVGYDGIVDDQIGLRILAEIDK